MPNKSHLLEEQRLLKVSIKAVFFVSIVCIAFGPGALFVGAIAVVSAGHLGSQIPPTSYPIAAINRLMTTNSWGTVTARQ